MVLRFVHTNIRILHLLVFLSICTGWVYANACVIYFMEKKEFNFFFLQISIIHINKNFVGVVYNVHRGEKKWTRPNRAHSKTKRRWQKCGNFFFGENNHNHLYFTWNAINRHLSIWIIMVMVPLERIKVQSINIYMEFYMNGIDSKKQLPLPQHKCVYTNTLLRTTKKTIRFINFPPFNSLGNRKFAKKKIFVIFIAIPFRENKSLLSRKRILLKFPFVQLSSARGSC